MVADKDGGARLVEVAVGVEDLKGHAGGRNHEPLESAAGRPLRNAPVACEAQGDRGEDTIRGGDEHRDVRSQAAGAEASYGGHRGEEVEGDGQGGVASYEVCEVGE